MIKANHLFCALLTLTTLSLFGQLAPSACGDLEERNTMLNTFIAQTKGGVKQRRDAAKTARAFVKIYGNCPDVNTRNAIASIRSWQAANDNAAAAAFVDAVNNNPSQAFAAAQPLIAAHPDDLTLQLALVLAGAKALKAGDKSHAAEAFQAAQTALQLIASGKTTDDWTPFTNAQDAPDGLRYYSAIFCIETAPEKAVANLTAITHSKSSFSTDAVTYQLLAGATYKTEVTPLLNEYQSSYAGKPESAEGKALRGRVNESLDRVITSYARAVALSAGKPSQAQLNASARNALEAVYAQRHDGSKDGLDDVVKGAQ